MGKHFLAGFCLTYREKVLRKIPQISPVTNGSWKEEQKTLPYVSLRYYFLPRVDKRVPMTNVLGTKESVIQTGTQSLKQLSLLLFFFVQQKISSHSPVLLVYDLTLYN